MLRRRLVALLAAGLACAAVPVGAEVVASGGLWYGAPLLWAPAPILWPYPGAWYPYAAPSAVPYAAPSVNYRAPDFAPSCLRIGRCTVEEVQFYYRRPEVLERRAPTAPETPSAAPPFVPVFPHGVVPTSDEAVQPAYRGASLPREEFSESGMPLDGDANGPR
jgi:hypothetical protein